jgi:hypothetical protein
MVIICCPSLKEESRLKPNIAQAARPGCLPAGIPAAFSGTGLAENQARIRLE